MLYSQRGISSFTQCHELTQVNRTIFQHFSICTNAGKYKLQFNRDLYQPFLKKGKSFPCWDRNVLYKAECFECKENNKEAVYIGETCKSLQRRSMAHYGLLKGITGWGIPRPQAILINRFVSVNVPFFRIYFGAWRKIRIE